VVGDRRSRHDGIVLATVQPAEYALEAVAAVRDGLPAPVEIGRDCPHQFDIEPGRRLAGDIERRVGIGGADP
jgi:hypothetical protein